MYLSGNIGISKYEISQATMINVINIELKINLLIKYLCFYGKKFSKTKES